MNRPTPIGNQLTDEIIYHLLGNYSIPEAQCTRILRAIVFGNKLEQPREQYLVEVFSEGFKKLAIANENRKKNKIERNKRYKTKRTLINKTTPCDVGETPCDAFETPCDASGTPTIQYNTIQDNTIQYPPKSPQGGDERDFDEDEFRDVCERMKARHPRKEQFDSLNRVLRGVLKKNPGAKLADIEGAHVSWCGTERWSDPEYAPVLVGWLKRGGWKDPVPEEKREEIVEDFEYVNPLECCL